MDRSEFIGIVINNKYKISSDKKKYFLGNGAYGEVFFATSLEDNKNYALKRIPEKKLRKNIDKKYYEREKQVMKKASQYKNPFIMKFIEEFKYEDSYFLVCEYCNGGSLESLIEKEIKTLEIEKKKDIFYEVALGVYFLHKQGISHRDLKGDNILLNNGIIKICDFGFANDEETMFSIVGTPLYMAPEIIDNDRKRKYNNKVDIWALGVILYQLLFEDYYFYKTNRNALYKDIQKKKFVLRETKKLQIGEDLANLIDNMFKKKPLERFDIDQVLYHPSLEKQYSKYKRVIEDNDYNLEEDGN